MPRLALNLAFYVCMSNDENYSIQCYSLAVALEFFGRHRKRRTAREMLFFYCFVHPTITHIDERRCL